MKPEVGQKVFLKPINNAVRDSTEVKEEIILKVGRKYFEVWDGENEWSATKFHLDSLRQVTDYSPDYQLYFSKQELLDEQEANDLTKSIRRTFGNYGETKLTLDQLRRIHTITQEVSHEET